MLARENGIIICRIYQFKIKYIEACTYIQTNKLRSVFFKKSDLNIPIWRQLSQEICNNEIVLKASRLFNKLSRKIVKNDRRVLHLKNPRRWIWGSICIVKHYYPIPVVKDACRVGKHLDVRTWNVERPEQISSVIKLMQRILIGGFSVIHCYVNCGFCDYHISHVEKWGCWN